MLRAYKTNPSVRVYSAAAIMSVTTLASYWFMPMLILSSLCVFHIFYMVLWAEPLQKGISLMEYLVIGPAKLVTGALMVMFPLSDDGYLNFAWIGLAVVLFHLGFADLYDALKSKRPNFRWEFTTSETVSAKQRSEQELAEQSLAADLEAYLTDLDTPRR